MKPDVYPGTVERIQQLRAEFADDANKVRRLGFNKVHFAARDYVRYIDNLAEMAGLIEQHIRMCLGNTHSIIELERLNDEATAARDAENARIGDIMAAKAAKRNHKKLARLHLSRMMRKMGRKGGRASGPARMAKIPPAKRKAIARKAGLASGRARRAKVK